MEFKNGNKIEELEDKSGKIRGRKHFESLPEEVKLQMELDALIFGEGFCVKNKDGSFERIDPKKIVLNTKTNRFEIKK